MVRQASVQGLSSTRGWPGSSTFAQVASAETTGFTLYPIFRTQKFVSPTDKMVTPVSQKLNAAKKKHFDKYVALFQTGSLPALNLNP